MEGIALPLDSEVGKAGSLVDFRPKDIEESPTFLSTSEAAIDPLLAKTYFQFAKDHVKEWRSWPSLQFSFNNSKWRCLYCKAEPKHQKNDVKHEARCPYLGFKRFEQLLSQLGKNDTSSG